MTDIAGSWSAESLTGSEDYFLKVLIPNKNAFFGTPSTFASALNLATALFHFHEWLFEEYKPQLEAHFSRPFNSAGEFWQAVQDTDPKFGYIRDVTNASKHVKIGEKHPTSTGMSHIADTHIVFVRYGQSGYGHGRYGGGPNVVFNDGQNQISFDDCALDLFQYWKSLLGSITGQVHS